MNLLTTTEAIQEPKNAKVLLIDNFDSFTYNIKELLARIGVDVTVVRNDAITIDEIRMMDPSHIIISPGPGTPENPEDIGVSSDAIAFAIEENKALLGVCLGEQSLVHHFGGRVLGAREILHGKTSLLTLTDAEDEASADLYADIEEPIEVMRYHSLAADPDTFPHEDLVVTATSEDGTIMSVAHREKAVFGVQFHPESFVTPGGEQMLRNFLSARSDAFAVLREQGIPLIEHAEGGTNIPQAVLDQLESAEVTPFSIREFPCDLDPERLIELLHGTSEDSYCFESLKSGVGDESRGYSYFGSDALFTLSARNEQLFLDDQLVESDDQSPFDSMDAAFEHMRVRAAEESGGDAIPMQQQMSGGFVGGMSFEAFQYQEPTAIPESARTPEGQNTFAYAYFDDGLIRDNESGKYFYYTRGRDRFDKFQERTKKDFTVEVPKITQVSDGLSQEQFEANVRSVKKKIMAGETFQAVISRKKEFTMEGSIAPLYNQMRDICPSGNMHFINIAGTQSIGSFPELILRIEDRKAITYQIAGTRKRSGDELSDADIFEELRTDKKEVAEHTMLVDLARNDLARSSMPGTQILQESDLFQRLDAGPVMHLASHVGSELNGMTPMQSLLSVHPMGTVSGAPKVRSTRILYEHEDGQPRGMYGGSIGFADVRGNLEAVVGLRSIILENGILKIQAGAGIVMDSDPTAEYNETEQKMGTTTRTISPFLTDPQS